MGFCLLRMSGRLLIGLLCGRGRILASVIRSPRTPQDTEWKSRCNQRLGIQSGIDRALHLCLMANMSLDSRTDPLMETPLAWRQGSLNNAANYTSLVDNKLFACPTCSKCLHHLAPTYYLISSCTSEFPPIRKLIQPEKYLFILQISSGVQFLSSVNFIAKQVCG